MKAHVDMETQCEVDLKDRGLHNYPRGKQRKIMCMAYAFDDGPVHLWKYGDPAPVDLLMHVHEGGAVYAHNAPFELEWWNEVGVNDYGWPPLSPEQSFCTMAMAYSMALPGALERVAPALGLTFEKDMEGGRIMLQLAKPRQILPDGTAIFWTPEEAPEKFERMYKYCMMDVEVERAAELRMLQLSPSERALWLLDYKINQRGIQVDLKAVEVAIEIVALEKKRLDERMREVTNNAVGTCTANGQLTDWIVSRGVDASGVSKDRVVEMLKGELPSDVREALLLRQEAAKSSTAKLDAMLAKASADGRVRNIAQFHGAGTGRWSGRGIQTQNFPRPNMKQEDIEAVLELMRTV